MEIKHMKAFEPFTEISSHCYPGMKLTSKEAKRRYTEHRQKMDQEAAVEHVGIYDDNRLAGGSIHYTLPMNVYQQTVPSMGIGTVAVDLPYKKQGLAKQIIQHFINKAKENNCPITHLYPFRPDFYRRMGFGFGPQLNVFQFGPEQLPSFSDASAVSALGEENVKEVQDCYNRWAEKTHGACDKEDYEYRFLGMEDTQTVGTYMDGKLEGYMSFKMNQQAKDTFLQHDLHITGWFANSTDAFQSLMNFLHNQKDQVRSITFPTFNDTFAFLLDDPRHTNKDLIFNIYHETHRRGTGVMYRITDVPLFFKYMEDHSYSANSIKINFAITDSFMNTDVMDCCAHFTPRGVTLADKEEADVTVNIDIAELSSLLMGCVTLEELIFVGKASPDGPAKAIQTAKEVFSNPVKPENWSFI